MPKRLTPGFEHWLSIGALVGIYVLLALGLSAGALAMRSRYGEGGDPGLASRQTQGG